jgi:invasion protein IalB
MSNFSIALAGVRRALTGASVCFVLAAPASGQSADTGPNRISETFRDWVVQCATRETETGPVRTCQMVQDLTRTTDGSRVLNVNIRQNDEGQGIVQVTVPLGVLLAQGVRVSVAEEELARFGYLLCVEGGCVARGVLEPDAVGALQRSGEAQVTIQGTEPISIGVSLMGFTAAWERIAELDG